MRHLMWILTWIAVGIGGVLGAATVVMLSASRNPPPPVVDADNGPQDRTLVTKPRQTTD
jgi:hypothetical protein